MRLGDARSITGSDRMRSKKLWSEGARQDLAVHVFWDRRDRKSTRLNSSHLVISYAVFCLKKKKSNHLLQAANRHLPIRTFRARVSTRAVGSLMDGPTEGRSSVFCAQLRHFRAIVQSAAAY